MLPACHMPQSCCPLSFHHPKYCRWGRRTSFFIILFLEVNLSILTAFSPNYLVYTVLRTVNGLFFPAIYQIPFILGKYIWNWQHLSKTSNQRLAKWGISCLTMLTIWQRKTTYGNWGITDTEHWNTVVLPYPRVIRYKTYRGWPKPRIVANPIYKSAE
jgi:hypothetical protein